jgi:hypothetical protein
MFNVFIFCSNQEVFVERQVVTFVDILSVAGGFANIIILLARYASKLFSLNAFQWDIVRETFMVEGD